MNRRDTLAAMLTIAACPAAFAQSRPKIVRLGMLTYGISSFTEQYVQAFRDNMKTLGYVEGRNLAIDWRRAEFSRPATDRLAEELIASGPAVILAQGYAIRAVASRSKTIPTIGAFSGDMVDAGLVKSLAHPGGNVTGVQLLALELVGKRIELLKELLPRVARIAVIADPQHAGEHRERDVSLKAAERLGIKTSYHPAKNYEELDAALETARAAGAEALVLFPDSVTNSRTAQIAAFALKHRLATVAGWANYADAGQLVTYGPNLHASWARLAHYVDRILKGAAPATLPVEMPSVLELVVNLKTARALGIAVPRSILLRADRVVE